MKNSLFKQLFKIISVASVGTIIITILFCSLVVKQYFLNLELKDTQQKVKYMISSLDKYDDIIHNNIDTTSITSSIIKYYNTSKIVVKSESTYEEGIKEKDFTDEEIDVALSPYLAPVLSGSSIKGVTKLVGTTGDVLLIGEPVSYNGDVIGAIFVIKFSKEVTNTLMGFYFVIAVSMALSLVAIMVPVSMFTKKVFIPLDYMTKCAIAMSEGNFSIRTQATEDDEIGQLSKAFNYLASRLEENDKQARLLEQTRRDYVANVSHELKTPVSSIRAIAETLNDDNLTDRIDRKKYHSMILRESMRLESLIGDMLELSRLQSGNIALEKSVVRIDDILAEVIDKFEVMANDLEIEFVTPEFLEDAPLLYTNFNRIVQVLVILLDNAFKFTTSEGQVRLQIKYKKEYMEVHVHDTGVGIPKEDIPFIFDRFYKVDKAHASKGTGIGLSIAHEIMIHLGEDIYAKSEIGQGSRFIFTIHYQV